MAGASGDGLVAWLVGGVLAGLVLLALLVGAYAIGYDRGQDAAGPAQAAPVPTETEPVVTSAPTDPLDAGREVFASAGCGSCHALADAGATGSVGPDLDALQPSAAQVAAIVETGRGAMPPFGDTLDAREIEDVAAYVSAVAGD
ncbi:MAG TPA: cytochrome c [Gaiellaceae bacterium]|nr:cytochrome c [Gaiellaceae bacterium]